MKEQQSDQACIEHRMVSSYCLLGQDETVLVQIQ